MDEDIFETLAIIVFLLYMFAQYTFIFTVVKFSWL
jgi:hypothetical protein